KLGSVNERQPLPLSECQRFSRKARARHHVAPGQARVAVQDSPQLLQDGPSHILLLVLALINDSISGASALSFSDYVDTSIVASTSDFNVISHLLVDEGNQVFKTLGIEIVQNNPSWSAGLR